MAVGGKRRRASRSCRAASVACAVVALVASDAGAQQPPGPTPRTSLRYVNFLGGQINPRGFGDDFRIRYRHRLYESARPALEQNFLGLNGGAGLSAAAVRPTIGFELQPLSILGLGFNYNPIYYFDGFGLAQTYPSPRADYRSRVLGPPKDRAGGTYPLFVHQLTFTGLLQLKVRSIFLRSLARLTHVITEPRDGDRVVYDPLDDIPVYRRGWLFHDDVDGGVFLERHLLAGLRYTLIAAPYPSAAFAPGEPREANDSPIHRLGPIVSYTAWERGAVIDTVTVSMLVQWYLAHRFRTGEELSAAVPLVGAAVTIAGDVF